MNIIIDSEIIMIKSINIVKFIKYTQSNIGLYDGINPNNAYLKIFKDDMGSIIIYDTI